MACREVQPVYLLADSQLLFWHGRSGPFLKTILSGISPHPRIAYVGASDGDSAEGHSIFKAAVEQIDSARPHHVRASYPDEDREFLETADVIVLAGGDVETGWNAFNQTGLRKQIRERYLDGALIIGVSAGAVQCGSHAAVSRPRRTTSLIETFGFAAYIVDAHDEKNEWVTLATTVHLLEGGAEGLGIPAGGALAVHPDGTLEPIRRAVDQYTYRDGRVRHTVLVPNDER